MDRWVGKVAVVTGASSGIGAAATRKMVKAGITVVGLARRAENIEIIKKSLEGMPGKLYAVKTDISKKEDVINAFAWIAKNVGPVHILLNNAGIGLHDSLLDDNFDARRSTIDTNLMGVMMVTNEAIKVMKANSIDGHIIFINSIVGNRIIRTASSYGISKHALTTFTELLRLEMADSGCKIKITGIHPGAVDTDMLKRALALVKIKIPKLNTDDFVDTIMFVLGTPPTVQISNMTVQHVLEQM